MIEINKEKCIGCGICVELYGEVFEMQSDGKAGVKKGVKKGKDTSNVKDVIGACPVSAISEY